MSTPRVLVVDDDRAVRTVLKVNLGKEGMDVTLATTAVEAMERLRERPYDVVLTDVKMPGHSGLDLLTKIKATWPETQVVVMTGYGSVEDAVSAIKAGAADYIIKPVARDELLLVIDRALENRALRAELVQLRAEVQRQYGFENLVGASSAMVNLYEQVAAVAETSATVLLQGPTGTGKELLSHALHYRSRRASGAFVRVNCGAIPESLLESELFGHEKGAFTGAIRQHVGRFEQADGGTLFLDEIGEINPHMQVQLLRVLQNGEFQRVGGTKTLRADVRVIAATNRDLRVEVEGGRFREDLFYRLNVVSLRVPALSERRDDIPLLVDHFMARLCEEHNKTGIRVSRSNMSDLMAYDWPGNVRQLEHLIERSLILHRGNDLFEIRLPEAIGSTKPPKRAAPTQAPVWDGGLTDALKELERSMIIDALREAGGVQARAANHLQVSRSNLNYRIQKLGIRVKDVMYD